MAQKNLHPTTDRGKQSTYETGQENSGENNQGKDWRRNISENQEATKRPEKRNRKIIKKMQGENRLSK